MSSTEEIKNQIISRLKKADFHILYYKSITTDSHYIKIDYGICNSIRISNHKGKEKLAYRYNVRIDQKGIVTKTNKKYPEFIYGIDCIDQLIIDIKKRRTQKKKYMSSYEYREKMETLQKRKGKEKGFWKNCIEV